MSSSKASIAILLLVICRLTAQVSTEGVASGTVLDAHTGRAISGVQVRADDQAGGGETTDSDGHFSIRLTAGVHTLTFSAANYTDSRLSDVEVRAGDTTQTSTLMANKTGVTVDVVEKLTALAATADAMLADRKLAPAVTDSISREELVSGTASDAAGALEKVTGVSVVGDGFVYVRGLGERYSSTMLNGATVPTTEPEKRVVPLDLFPAGLLDNVRIIKTYTPDLPAEFAGGLVQLSTIEFPTERTLKVSFKSGMNTQTSLNPYLGYPGGGRDFLGFDDGTRAIPSIIPSGSPVFAGPFTRPELQKFGQAFSDNWEPVERNFGRPLLDWKAVVGGTFGRLGIVGAFSFNNTPQRQSELQRYLRQGGSAPVIFTEYPNFKEYTEHAQLGAVFNAAIRLSQTDKLIFRNTLTHDAEKSSRSLSGYDGGVDSFISAERLRWIQRNLFATSVEGDDSFPAFHNSLLHWQFTYSRSSRSEPDLREVFRGLLPNGSYIFSGFGSSGVRFFSDLSDRIYEPQADYSIPFFKGSVSGLFKMGGRASLRSRDFGARRFRYIPQDSSTLNLFLPSNQLFAPENIRPDGFQITEFTRGTDSYTGDMNIYAGYAMVDLAFGSRLRLVGGLRYENADIRVTTVDNRIPNAIPQTAKLNNTDPTPGVNVIYALTQKQNLRFAYSHTLSRPDFRELSPFDFTNVLGGFTVQGNPDLKRATIDNYDVRWERFPGGNQVLAVSFFAKRFTDPIEQIILPSNDLRQTFRNAKSARNIGFELEYRKALGTVNRRLRAFAVSGNLTFVDSNIQIRPEDAGVLTTLSRPLLGQSRYIWNAGVEWAKASLGSKARLYANRVSRRLDNVGTFQLPDIYQEASMSLDFVYEYTPAEKSRWVLRVDAENLTDHSFRWTQGDFVQRAYRLGRTVEIGLTYTIF